MNIDRMSMVEIISKVHKESYHLLKLVEEGARFLKNLQRGHRTEEIRNYYINKF